MQTDFINEIENAKPKYVVFVNLAVLVALRSCYPNALPERSDP